MVAQTHTYDVVIRLPDGKSFPYLYGAKGGLSIGHGLLEPSAPSRVDTIPIQTLHHGYGRIVATDPAMARDSNGEQVFCDLRQPGFIMPGGALELLDTVAIEIPDDLENSEVYGAAFTTDAGDVVFGVGKQLIQIDAETEAVTDFTVSMSDVFSGSVVEWNRDAWLGVCSAADYGSVGAYNYDEDDLNTTNTYMFSWAASNRNAIFWIRNRTGAAPQFRWSDRTDQDFGAFNTNFIYPNATNAYVLEIPKALVTGMGSAGQYVLFASKGGNIWGFNAQEVFVPLTPDQTGGFIDNRFGGPMRYVGSWLLVPNIDGIGRFDPRNVSLTDISPSVHQGSTPLLSENDDKRAYYTSTTPTGALIAAGYLGADTNILQLEMYEDGMFWHPALLNLGDVSRIWAMIVTRYKTSGQFTSQLKAFIIAADADYTNWEIYKLDLATAAWSPGPAMLADVSGFRTGFYTTRPPDINASPTQIRGYAQASDDNPITLNLLVDNDESETQVGIIVNSGPFVLPVPADVPAGRKFAVSGSLAVTDQDGDVPYLTLPLSIDYRYVEASRADDKVPDFFTLKVMASSTQINKVTSRLFSHGRSEADYLISLTGKQIEVQFSDQREWWTAIVEDADANQLTFEDGRTAPDYLVSLVCRRV